MTIILTFFVLYLVLFFGAHLSSIPSVKPKIPKRSFPYNEQALGKWERCKRLISGQEKIEKTSTLVNDSEILEFYKASNDCHRLLDTHFVHPSVTVQEQQLPIAFGLTVYKGARLFERILQAIYMPHNVYCIYIDKKSPEVFRGAIQAMIRCLPNVFISSKSIDVVWGHISLVQAQLSCMEGLLQSSMKWKYYISLVGQDFPLYDNEQIVTALQGLNNLNNIGSYPMPKELLKERINLVYKLKNYTIKKTKRPKSPPPHNITVHKGSTHIIAIREFVEFVLHSKIGKDLFKYLKDTFIPDETLYATLQQHPLAPGGIRGKQGRSITRALHWSTQKPLPECRGVWVRSLCWISIGDLRWALGRESRYSLFVHKIPFDFNDELLECILVARQGRKYGTTVCKQEEATKRMEKKGKDKKKKLSKVSKVFVTGYI